MSHEESALHGAESRAALHTNVVMFGFPALLCEATSSRCCRTERAYSCPWLRQVDGRTLLKPTERPVIACLAQARRLSS